MKKIGSMETGNDDMEGAKEAFEVIFKAYQPLLRHLVHRISYLGEWEEAMSVASIALYDAYLRFDPKKGSFGAFAKRYVRGRLLHYVGKEKKYRERQQWTGKSREEDGEGREIENLVQENPIPAAELSLDIKKALHSLTEKERRCIVAIYVEGLPLARVAEREGVSHATVSTWKLRGLSKLKKELFPRHDF
ncbi:putative RNA polymerase, sigma-24 subunit, ECF subfamily [[Clostridium] ultunense Esp]|nr:putative RNA polymerase, sigma-24 subunit, ECF subfamily [[Clostridium] ultunense Esp]